MQLGITEIFYIAECIALMPVMAEEGTLTLKSMDGSISLTFRSNELPDIKGKVLYIGDLTDDLADITSEVRILHLTRDTVQRILDMGYE